MDYVANSNFEEETYPNFPVLVKSGAENHIIHTILDDIHSTTTPQVLHGSDLPSPVGQFHLTRLNDVLRACGFPAVSRGLDSMELISACTEAIMHLSARNRDLKELSHMPAPIAAKHVPVELLIPVQQVSVNPDLVRMKKELFQLKTELANEKSAKAHLEHLLSQREEEIENLRYQLSVNLAEEDKRSALAVSTVREENLGIKAMNVINNYQREISILEKSNKMYRENQRELELFEDICKKFECNRESLAANISKLMHYKDTCARISRLVEKVTGPTLEDKILLLLATARPPERSNLGEQICQIFDIKSEKSLIPILKQIALKTEEFDAFYASLCCLLGLGARASFSECLHHLSNSRIK